jgi:hypothetical protein
MVSERPTPWTSRHTSFRTARAPMEIDLYDLSRGRVSRRRVRLPICWLTHATQVIKHARTTNRVPCCCCVASSGRNTATLGHAAEFQCFLLGVYIAGAPQPHHRLSPCNYAAPSGCRIAARGHLCRSCASTFQATNAPLPSAQVCHRIFLRPPDSFLPTSSATAVLPHVTFMATSCCRRSHQLPLRLGGCRHFSFYLRFRFSLSVHNTIICHISTATTACSIENIFDYSYLVVYDL